MIGDPPLVGVVPWNPAGPVTVWSGAAASVGPNLTSSTAWVVPGDRDATIRSSVPSPSTSGLTPAASVTTAMPRWSPGLAPTNVRSATPGASDRATPAVPTVSPSMISTMPVSERKR